MLPRAFGWVILKTWGPHSTAVGAGEQNHCPLIHGLVGHMRGSLHTLCLVSSPSSIPFFLSPKKKFASLVKDWLVMEMAFYGGILHHGAFSLGIEFPCNYFIASSSRIRKCLPKIFTAFSH